MRKPRSMKGLEDLGRVRLSPNFFFRDFLYSEIANFYGIPNIPENPALAVEAGSQLCCKLLEPLQKTFGRIGVRSGYRSREVTAFGAERGFGARIEANAAYHIWDMRDNKGAMGAAACIRGLLTTIGNAQIGVGSPGGFTTTFLIAISSSIPSSVPSTFCGVKIRRDGSTVSSSQKAVSRNRRIPIMAAVMRIGIKDFRHWRHETLNLLSIATTSSDAEERNSYEKDDRGWVGGEDISGENFSLQVL
jgi:hypothetical protein